ncbi:MAG: hypothetical protein J3R72DRAFT_495263 [Linnemannia gamsii]|nr:MAG: hypothetical protein J3R72DRAFT_495263 [Linnemannia gamsii]
MTLNLLASSLRPQPWSQEQQRQQAIALSHSCYQEPPTTLPLHDDHQQPPSSPTTTHSKSCNNYLHNFPLFIPEILEPILTLLDQKTLLASRLVCSTWAAIARPCLSLESLWHDNNLLSSMAKEAFFDRLAISDTLVVKFSPKNVTTLNKITPNTDSTANVETGGDRGDSLFGSTTSTFRRRLHQQQHPYRVKKLILRDAYEFHARLEAFLDVFPTLATLTLESLIKGPLRMDILLRSCPSLRSLSIEYALCDLVLWGPIVRTAAASQPQPQQVVQQGLNGSITAAVYINRPLEHAPLSGYGLQALVLRHVMSRQDILQAMLQTLPHLQSLEIRFLRPIPFTPDPEIFKCPLFYRSLSGSCPNLRTFHLSLFQRLLTVPDSIALCEALPSLTGLSFPSQDLESYRQSFKTIGPDTPRMGILEVYVNHLTRLELLVYRPSQEESLITNLHAFLTEATHLQHLIAPKIYYWTEYLECRSIIGTSHETTDIVGITVAGQHQVHQSAIMSSAAGQAWHSCSPSSSTTYKFNPPWGWACRGLETLHLGFKTRVGCGTAVTNDSDMYVTKKILQTRTRVMFGFIARNCPLIKDLQIRRSYLDLSLESGFCLLTQLTQLEKMVIWSQSKALQLLESDLNWIGYSNNTRDDGSGKVQGIGATLSSAKPAVVNKAGSSISGTNSTTTTKTVAAAISGTTAVTTTIAIATSATAATNISTAPTSSPPATTIATHNRPPPNHSTHNSNPITTVKNTTNININNINSSINNLNISTTTNNIDNNPGGSSSRTKSKDTKRKLGNFFRRHGPPSSSSSPSSLPPKSSAPNNHYNHGQDAIQQQQRDERFFHNMPTNVKAIYKTDTDWFLTTVKPLFSKKSPSSSVPSHLPREPVPALVSTPPFANKDESEYRCWPHLRTIVWAFNPDKVFNDDRAAKVFSNLRPDIDFKVQQYIEQW